MIGKLDSLFAFHAAALRLRAERQQVIASNISNADTPEFKARDFDFREAMRGALARGAEPSAAPAPAQRPLMPAPPAYGPQDASGRPLGGGLLLASAGPLRAGLASLPAGFATLAPQPPAATGGALATTAPGHLAGRSVSTGGAPLRYREAVQGSVDGNTVDMDVERNRFVDNAVRYEASVVMLSGQVRSMQTVLQGQ